MLVRTLTRAAGRLNFEAGVEIELEKADAELLADAGAVQIIDPKKKKVKEPEPNGASGDGDPENS